MSPNYPIDYSMTVLQKELLLVTKEIIDKLMANEKIDYLVSRQWELIIAIGLLIGMDFDNA